MGRELLAPATWANQAPHGIAADINSGRSCLPCQTRKRALRNSNRTSCKGPWPQPMRRARRPSTSGWLRRAPPRISMQRPSQESTSGHSKTYLKLKGAVRMKLTIARKSNTNVPSSEKTSGLLSGVGTLDAAHDIAVRPGESCAAVDTPRMHNCCAAKHHSAFGRFSVQCPGTSSPEGEGEGNRNNTAVGQPALAHLPSSDLSNLQTAIYSETNGLRSWVGDKYNSAIDPAPCIFKLLRNVETTPWTVRPKLSIGIQESPKP